MRYCIVPSNSKRYRLVDFLRDHNQVDWKLSRFKYAVDDIVFIYSAKPDQKLTHVMRVTQVNIKFKDSIPDDGYWVDRAAYSASIAEDNFCRFELIEEIQSDKLTLEKLMEHGMTKAPQSAQTLKADTLKYIFQILGKEYL
jgi:hypothetical protein